MRYISLDISLSLAYFYSHTIIVKTQTSNYKPNNKSKNWHLRFTKTIMRYDSSQVSFLGNQRQYYKTAS